jgi:hypothetical protein
MTTFELLSTLFGAFRYALLVTHVGAFVSTGKFTSAFGKAFTILVAFHGTFMSTWKLNIALLQTLYIKFVIVIT